MASGCTISSSLRTVGSFGRPGRPVLFGDGRRLFEVLRSRVELDIIRVINTPEATHIRYRVRR
jgi:hypothetical protein